jgi:hypothetical protein
LLSDARVRFVLETDMLKKMKSWRWWLMAVIVMGVGTATSTGCFYDDHGHDHDHHDDHWDHR